MFICYMYFDKAPESVFKEAYCRHAAPPTECQNILLIQSSCAKRDFNLCYICSLFQQHHWLFFSLGAFYLSVCL